MLYLNVALGERSYPIFLGTGSLRHKNLLDPYLGNEGTLVVTNEVVAPLYLAFMDDILGSRNFDTLILPDGEQYKSLDTLNLIFDTLLSNGHGRNTTLIALGGGVTGDITGFAAACYQRGGNFIQIPTTLLAQVDSSIGGKTAVNHRLGKNMIGAFHQPQAVLIDVDTLDTLPDREFRSGLAEVIKYGLIVDRDFFVWLEENIGLLLARDREALLFAIERSCRSKAQIVSADEKETGLRAILNFGHTFGHAIETFLDYSSWLHGEAVAAGMVMASDLSAGMGWLHNNDVLRIKKLLEKAGLPLAAPENMTSDNFFELMAVDKKVSAGIVRLVLLKAIGQAVVSSDYDTQILRDIMPA